jgi:hypothetical protein
MADPFDIADGVPNIWDSQSIVPSIEVAPSPTGPTPLPTIDPSASNVYVYVRVDSKTNVKIGCPIEQWKPPKPLTGFLQGGAGSGSNGDWTFSASASGDVLANTVDTTVKVNFGFPLSGCRCWGWSPDGKFFAYVFGPTTGNKNDWRVTILALDDARRFDGTTIVPTPLRVKSLTTYAPASTIKYTSQFTLANFGWVGSSGFFATGIDTAGEITRTVLCLRTSAVIAVEDPVPTTTSWLYQASPCGSQLACLPESTPTNKIAIKWISTVDAALVSAYVSGVSTTVKTDGAGPQIETIKHTRLGVSVSPGTGTPTFIDDPDETATLGGLTVKVDRIQASTWLGTQNVRAIGVAAGPEIAAFSSAWVQVPPPPNWINDNDQHWCLVAQAYDVGLGLKRLWPDTVAVFPTDKERCAQRNIIIKP